MSIVEKAVGKYLQSQTRLGAQARVGAGTPGKPVDDRALRRPLVPSYRISLDLALLHREGMLAPDSDSRKLIEQYRRIKWQLLPTALGQAPKPTSNGNLIMVTSSVPAEGKTFTSINLALSLAMEKDCSVLLVDADIGKSRMTELLGLRQRPGLTDVLAAKAEKLTEFVVDTDVDGLMVLPVGQRNAATPELFASRAMESLMSRLAGVDRHFIVLFDSSPVLATNESHLLARQVGQVLMIVRAGHTPKPAVLEALGLLGADRAVSLILNQVRAEFIAEYLDSYHGSYYESHSSR